MKFQVLYFGKDPSWVESAVGDYTRRMPELSLARIRNKPSRTKFDRMLQQAGSSSKIIMLDQRGQQWTTEQLTRNFQQWLMEFKTVSFLIGDSEGFTPPERQRVGSLWSLSKLTFPYSIARLIVCEQLYRAHSILEGHPYHRDES